MESNKAMDSDNTKKTPRGRQQGVTLVELMIVILVLGILTTIAYPNYRDYAARAQRNEAKAALLQIATNQERFYLNNNTYTTDLTQLGFATSPWFTDTGSYRIRVLPGANAAGYTAEADYQLGGNEESLCNIYTINQTGTKASTPQTDCWTRTR